MKENKFSFSHENHRSRAFDRLCEPVNFPGFSPVNYSGIPANQPTYSGNNGTLTEKERWVLGGMISSAIGGAILAFFARK